MKSRKPFSGLFRVLPGAVCPKGGILNPARTVPLVKR